MQEFLNRVEGFSQKRLTLLAYELQCRLDALEARDAEAIAIVGIGCRFPGGIVDPTSYWKLLRDGVEAVREVPADRWDIDAYYDANPDTPGKMSTRRGGFIDSVDRFDPQFFGISPREAETMDPQQRLLLEVTWEALEHAGMSADRIFGAKGGVFVGMSAADYYSLMREQGLDGFDAYTASGTAHSIASGRLSYALGLQGASLSIDTACSSSLVAIHQAVQALRHKECDFALTGGVNLILSPDISIALSKSHMMAPDGRCKTFDASADGFVRGEGCGVIVLKRLSDAQTQGDRIIAVIRGSAISQDGRSNGLTAPNGQAQETVLRDALTNARVEPSRVGYIEAHGTGTSLGDPIEVQALGTIFAAGRHPDHPLRLGSVKTNFGHLEAAAGVAGLIKVALALHHGELPPQLHFTKPNPFIPWDELPVKVVTQLETWPRQDNQPHVAGVSSFGFSGTNAHIVLEEAPRAATLPESSSTTASSERPVHVLTLSARQPEALDALTDAYAQRLMQEHTQAHMQENDTLANIAYTANTGRAHFAHRMAVVAPSRDVAHERLSQYRTTGEAAGILTGTKTSTRRPKIAFLFTGQGAQYAGMGRRLYDTQPVFRRALDQCAEILQPILPTPLLSVLFPAAGTVSPIDDTAYTQPALFAIEYALAELWASWGIRPSAVTGHSVGEYVAACVAGALSLEDALVLVATRGRLMGALPAGGAMAAVMADESRVAAAITPYIGKVSIAAINGPANTVISGVGAAIDAITRQFESEGVKVTRLAVSHAFHSPLLDPMLDEFTRAASAVTHHAPEIDLVSNVTGAIADADVITGSYWRDHARQPVRFADGVETLIARGYDLFVEIGPQPTLIGMAQAAVTDASAKRWFPSLRKGRDDWEQLLESVATLYVAGVDVDWVGFDREYTRQKVVLPTYPFQRERYWIEQRLPTTTPQNVPRDVAPPTSIASLLYDVAWRDLSADDEEPALPSPAQLAKAILPSIAATSAQTGFDQYADFQRELDTLSAEYIVQGLQRLGWTFTIGELFNANQLAEQLGVVARQRTLFTRLLDILGEDGILARTGSAWRVMKTPTLPPMAAQCATLMRRFPMFSAELTLTERCAEALASVLRAETDPLQLLFPAGSLNDAEKLYRDSPAARTYNGAIAEILRSIVSSAPAGKTLRILEIGAGTGGTTSYVLPVLDGYPVEYTFTDVSPLFASRARKKFQDYGFVQYTSLDIGSDLEAQGFVPGQYDIILGSNVIHATADLSVTMANVRRLMAPGGLVVLLEGTTPQRFGDLTVGLTDGWWAFTDTDRRSYALMPRDKWLALFAESGFINTVAIPGDDAGPSLSQQAIFVAQAEPTVAAQLPPLAGAHSVAPQESPARPQATWVLIPDTRGVADAVAQTLGQHGDRVIQTDTSDVAALQAAITTATTAELAGIVYLAGLDDSLDDTITSQALMESQRKTLGGLLDVVHTAVAASGVRTPRLWIVTRGAQAATPREGADPAQATLWGMSHVIGLEHPELLCTRLDLDPQGQSQDRETPLDATRDAELIARTLRHAGLHTGREDQIAFRASRRMGRRLARHAVRTGSSQPTVMQADATYLVTGGLRGLGLRVAEWLVAQGARHIALMGRRAPDATASDLIRRLEQQGATVRAVTGDVGNRHDVERVLATIQHDMPPLKGVIHSAGVLDDGVLTQLTWDRFNTVFGPKVYGTWHLHTLTRDLDFFVIFSSGASVAGSPGQANHASANAFEDALAHQRQAAGLPTVSINWGPWSEIGAAVDRKIGTSQFLGAITPRQGLTALEWAMRRDPASQLFVQAQLVVIPADWARLLGKYEATAIPPLYKELADELQLEAWRTLAHTLNTNPSALRSQTTAPASTPSTSSVQTARPTETLHQRITATPPNRRRTVLQEFVRTQAIKVLGAGSRERVDMTLPLRDLGLDSLMAVELRNVLGTAVGRTLPATLTFDHPTVDALVDYLAMEVFASEMAPAPAPSSSESSRVEAAAAASAARAEELNELSEDDLALLLAQQLDDLQ